MFICSKCNNLFKSNADFTSHGCVTKGIEERRLKQSGLTWREMFPEGREVFYEGKNPGAFALEIKREFGFDPRHAKTFNQRNGYKFLCPARHLDAIYGSGKYPLGS